MRRLLILTSIAVAAIAATAAAGVAQAPSWNSGYGWWPGGFGDRPVTTAAKGYPCSVTAYGPTFRFRHRNWMQFYGAGTSCVDGIGTKAVTVYLQVQGPHGKRWFTISSATATVGPLEGNPVRVKRTAPAYLGHAYRTLAVAKLIVPNGHAGCSLTDTCNESLTLTARSHGLAP